MIYDETSRYMFTPHLCSPKVLDGGSHDMIMWPLTTGSGSDGLNCKHSPAVDYLLLVAFTKGFRQHKFKNQAQIWDLEFTEASCIVAGSVQKLTRQCVARH